MELDVKDPRNLVFGLIALAGVGAGGHMIGLTIEPESVTELRVEKAKLEARVELLEGIADQCQDVLASARARALIAPEERTP